MIRPSHSGRGPRVAILAMVLAAGFAAFLAVGEIKRHHRLVQLSYDLSEVRQELREAETENRRLRLERSLLLAPERIERLAGELGMVRPGPTQIRKVGAREVARR